MEKSPILEATDLLRISLNDMGPDGLADHIRSVIDTIMALIESSLRPGFRSATAQISAKHLETKLRAHLADAILRREALLADAAVPDEEEEGEKEAAVASQKMSRYCSRM